MFGLKKRNKIDRNKICQKNKMHAQFAKKLKKKNWGVNSTIMLGVN